MAAHGFADGFDVLSDVRLAPFPETQRIRRKGRKRRLQPMRQVSGATAGPFDFAFLRIDQRVDFLDEGVDFGRDRRLQMPATSRSDIGHSAAQRDQRTQADSDLDPGRKGQYGAKKNERYSEVFGEGSRRRRHLRKVFGHGKADDHRLAVRRNRDGALGH
jgi:hypothetical protein